MMKKNAIALSVAALVGGLGFAGGASASAIQMAGGADAPGSTATQLVVNNGGIGHSLYVPYFTVQNGNSTLINIVNTDTINGKAVKIRFRGASNSDDLFDFQLFLSPGDVWSANINQAADGRAQLTTTDKSCTLPASVNQAFVLDRLPTTITATERANQTREGYIEIFTMADVPPQTLLATGVLAAPVTANAMFTAIKHVGGVAPCTGATLQVLVNDITTEGQAYTTGFKAPTTGLFGNFSIVNMKGAATSWTGEMPTIVAVDATNVVRPGNFVFFPQTSAPAPSPDSYTSDPALRTVAGAALGNVQNGAGAATAVTVPVIQALMFDLPDMSTPYVGAVGAQDAPLIQALRLSYSLYANTVSNEFLTDGAISAKTDWVFSMPTRRYSVALDYRPGATQFTRVFSNLSQAVGGAPVPANAQYFNASNTQVVAGQVCVTANSIRFYDREETTTSAGFVISPGTATSLSFCGETSVLSINAGSNTGPSALSAVVARSNLETGFVNGWATFGTTGLGFGLPVVGKAYLLATNPTIGAGLSAQFGGSWEHRYTR